MTEAELDLIESKFVERQLNGIVSMIANYSGPEESRALFMEILVVLRNLKARSFNELPGAPPAPAPGDPRTEE